MAVFKRSTWRVVASMETSCSPAVPTLEKERTRISGRGLLASDTRVSQENSKGERSWQSTTVMYGAPAKADSNNTATRTNRTRVMGKLWAITKHRENLDSERMDGSQDLWSSGWNPMSSEEGRQEPWLWASLQSLCWRWGLQAWRQDQPTIPVWCGLILCPTGSVHH